MDKSLKNAAILANLSALRMTLAGALERAADAENAIKWARSIKPSARFMDSTRCCRTPPALYAAALALHRSGRSMNINPLPGPPAEALAKAGTGFFHHHQKKDNDYDQLS